MCFIKYTDCDYLKSIEEQQNVKQSVEIHKKA